MDFRRRHEGGGRQVENAINADVKLGCCGEDSVVAGTGRGGNAVGDFALHHDDGCGDGRVVVEEMRENRRGDVVGKISHDAEFFVACAQCAEVHCEDVGLDYFDGGELRAELRGKSAVELDGDEAARAGGEERGDGSGAGTDFDYGFLRQIAERANDGRGGSGIDEKILSQFRFVLQTSSRIG